MVLVDSRPFASDCAGGSKIRLAASAAAAAAAADAAIAGLLRGGVEEQDGTVKEQRFGERGRFGIETGKRERKATVEA